MAKKWVNLGINPNTGQPMWFEQEQGEPTPTPTSGATSPGPGQPGFIGPTLPGPGQPGFIGPTLHPPPPTPPGPPGGRRATRQELEFYMNLAFQQGRISRGAMNVYLNQYDEGQPGFDFDSVVAAFGGGVVHPSGPTLTPTTTGGTPGGPTGGATGGGGRGPTGEAPEQAPGEAFRNYLLSQDYRRYNPLVQRQLEAQQGDVTRQYRLWAGASGQPGTFAEYLGSLQQGGGAGTGMGNFAQIPGLLQRAQAGENLGPQVGPWAEFLSTPGGVEGSPSIPGNLLDALYEANRRKVAPFLRGSMGRYLSGRAEDYFAQGGQMSTRTPASFAQYVQDWFR